MDLNRRFGWQQWSLLALVIFMTAGACAQSVDSDAVGEAPATKAQVTVVESAETPPAAASRAYVDPQTGRLVPAPAAGDEELPEALLPERLSRFQGDLAAVPLADGGQSVDLRGRFRTDTVAHVGADGRLHLECVDSHGATEAGTDPSATELDGDDHDN